MVVAVSLFTAIDAFLGIWTRHAASLDLSLDCIGRAMLRLLAQLLAIDARSFVFAESNAEQSAAVHALKIRRDRMTFGARQGDWDHAEHLGASAFFTLEAERAISTRSVPFRNASIAVNIPYGTVRSERFDSLQLRERGTKTYRDFMSLCPDSRLRAVGNLKWNFTRFPQGFSAHRGVPLCAGVLRASPLPQDLVA